MIAKHEARGQRREPLAAAALFTHPANEARNRCGCLAKKGDRATVASPSPDVPPHVRSFLPPKFLYALAHARRRFSDLGWRR